MKEKVVFCWSGGKDSALALYKVIEEGRYEVVSLLTTFNEHFQRVSMHGVRLELLDRQAQAVGLPLQKMFVTQRSSNEELILYITGLFILPVVVIQWAHNWCATCERLVEKRIQVRQKPVTLLDSIAIGALIWLTECPWLLVLIARRVVVATER